MKNATLIFAAGAMMWSAPANAALVGLYIAEGGEAPGGPGAPPTGGPREIYRVYAQFSNTTDRVNAWGIGGIFGAGGIFNVTAGNLAPGTGFTNVGFGAAGDIAPQAPNTTRDWDTYMTIGVLYGQEAPGGIDATQKFAGTPTFIPNAVNSWIPDPANSSGVFISPDDPQGSAAYRVSGLDSDHRVLLMQLVVNAGQWAKGTIGVSWQSAGQGGQTTTGMEFIMGPAPGPLAVLCIAGLVRSRRRRG